MPKRFSFAIIFLLVFSVSAFIPSETTVDYIVQQYQKWSALFPQEKIYVHLSKRVLLPYDTLYCKAYLARGNQNVPSLISRIAYIDIINAGGTVCKSLKLPVFDGIGWGAVSIDPALPPGDYLLRAYTNWMRNSDEEFFFTQPFTVLPTSKVQLEKAPFFFDTSEAYSCRFFPESGHLVSGFSSRLAFKALRNGLGIGVAGVITNEKREEVASFRAGYAGMGSALFLPLANHTYTASFTYDDGHTGSAELPPAVTDETGNATLEWYNSDLPGTYHVVLQGLSSDGKTGFLSFDYEVN